MSILDHEIKPLVNMLILKEVFSYCSQTDLLSVRLVCRKWMHESFTIWRKSGLVFLPFRCAGAKSTKFAKYVKRLSTGFQERPFVKYKLLFGISTSFSSVYSCFVKELILDRVVFTSVTETKKILFRACPFLEKLTLKDCRYKNSDFLTIVGEAADHGRGSFINTNMKFLVITETCSDYMDTELLSRLSWHDILEHYPNLAEIEFTEYPLTNAAELSTALARIRQLYPDRTPVSSLKIPVPEITGDIENLTAFLVDSKTSLSRLGLEFGAGVGRADWSSIMSAVKTGQGHNLEIFSIQMNTFDTDFFIPRQHPLSGLDRFVNLKEICVTGELVETLSFLHQIPLLIKLKLQCNGLISRSTTQIMGSKPLPLLEELELSALTYDSFVNVDRMFIWFPTLKRLTLDNLLIQYANPLFLKICQNWRRLEELRFIRVFPGTLSDEIISGFTATEILSLKELPFTDMKETKLTTVLPNLTWLVDLRTFAIRTQNEPYEKHSGSVAVEMVHHSDCLGNVSGVFGFLKLPKLSCLQLDVHKMSADFIDDLKTRVVRTELKRNH